MGLANWGRAGASGPESRRAASGLTALLAGVAATALIAASAHAQQAGQPGEQQDEQVGQAEASRTDESGATLLDKMMLASRTGETAIESLSSSSHVDQEQLDRRMAATPSEMLFGVPGVTIQADSQRAASSANIRGLQDFGRVAVIVDGARQDFQRSGHGTQSTFYLDPELVKSVDVIRGPVANTYGSGAIGGVVFFETKDAVDFLRPDETWAGSLTQGYESNGHGWTTSATGAYRFNDSVDALGNIVYRDYGAYKDGDGNRVDGSGFEVLGGLLKTTILPSDNSELKLGWVGASDQWNQFSGGSPGYDINLEQNTFTARYNITDDDRSWLDLHINGSFNGTRLEQTSLVPVGGRFDPATGLPVVLPIGTKANYDVGTSGFDIWNTSRFDTGQVAHELTYGGDWVSDDVDTTGAAGGDNFYTPSGKRRVSGAYIQDKLSWEWLEVIAGLRYDSYSLKGDDTNTSGDRLSPRISLGVSPFQGPALEGLQFYGTYAEGYRSPSLSETLISGLHPAGVVFPFLPNPALRPETGKTWEFGVNYKADGVIAEDDALRLKAAYFNNDVDDYIDGATLSAGQPGCPFLPGLPPVFVPGGFYVPACFQYQNFANAKIRGFEFESVYDAGWGFAGLSASLIEGYTVSFAGVRADLATIPSSQVTAQLGFRFFDDRLTVGGEVQYNGKPKGNPIAEDFTLVNTFASYQASDNLKLDFRIDNLFDVNYVNPLNATATSTVFEPGMTVKLAATMRFGG